jgi:hypothetical protein
MSTIGSASSYLGSIECSDAQHVGTEVEVEVDVALKPAVPEQGAGVEDVPGCG